LATQGLTVRYHCDGTTDFVDFKDVAYCLARPERAATSTSFWWTVVWWEWWVVGVVGGGMCGNFDIVLEPLLRHFAALYQSNLPPPCAVPS